MGEKKGRWWKCQSCDLSFQYPARLPDGTPVCPRCGSPKVVAV